MLEEELQRLLSVGPKNMDYESNGDPFPDDAYTLILDLRKVEVQVVAGTRRSLLDEAVFSALAECRHDMAKILLNYTGVNIWNNRSMTPLIYSYRYCSHQEVGKEIRGFILENMEEYKHEHLVRSELRTAIDYGDVEVVEKLFKKRPEYCSMVYFMALTISSTLKNKRNDIANLILDQDIQISQDPGSFVETLIAAAESDDLAIICRLHEKGVHSLDSSQKHLIGMTSTFYRYLQKMDRLDLYEKIVLS